MKSIQHIYVFISSPSDVENERKIVLEVIQNVNNLKGDALGYNFKPITWENDILPTFGAPPQEIIDAEVGDEYDVFLGIMSTKLGTPTKVAASGTLHEFERAYKRKMDVPESIEIMFYFQDPGHSGKKIVISELEKIEGFKSSLSDKGLYCEYNTTSDFHTFLYAHLPKLMDRVIEKDSLSHDNSVQEKPADDSAKAGGALVDPLALLMGLEDDEGLGYIELADDALDAFGAGSENLDALSNAIKILGTELGEHADSVKTINGIVSPQDKKVILRKLSRTMEKFVASSSAVLPLFRTNFAEGLQLSRELMIMVSQDNVGSEDEKNPFLGFLIKWRDGMGGSVTGLDEMSSVLGSLMRATSEFNRSKSRAKAVVDGTRNLIISMQDELDEIINSFESLQIN